MVSIIVPIYNVQNYLKRCLDSLVAISYRDSEFILIDDGSTDECYQIIKHYEDNRIRVFQTSNLGLSAARNLGIEKARGEWLMFVDGDDWVDPDFCSIPIKTAVKEAADIVIFQSCPVDESNWHHSITKKDKKRSFPIGAVSAENALKYGTCVAWNKLYKTELFSGIRYPEGRVYEDIAITHKILFKARKIVIIPDVLYYHLHHKNSISNTQSVSNLRDGFIAVYQKTIDIESYGWRTDEYNASLCTISLCYLMKAIPDNDLVFKQAETVIDSISGFPDGISWKTKLLLQIWRTDKQLFHSLCRIIGKKE